MEEAWEDVAWKDEKPVKEWYVEYIATVNDVKFHHMSILYGEDYPGVQRSLLHEVRRTYSSGDKIDVTIIKIEEASIRTDSALFEGIFSP